MKKTNVRIVSLLCALALMLTMVSVPAFAAGKAARSGVTRWEYDENGLSLEQYVAWSLAADGAITVAKTEKIEEAASEIPDELKTEIRSVVIQPGIEFVGEGAFYKCENLTSAVIPNGVRAIGQKAFGLCFNLTEVTLPEGLKHLGDSAFDGCALTNVVLPGSLVSIGDYAFDACPLTEITLPEGLEALGKFAFAESALTNTVVLPSSLVSVKGNPFSYCDDLSKVTLAPGNTHFKIMTQADGSEMLMSADGKNLYCCLKYPNHSDLANAFVRVPDGVACIKEGAFGYGYGDIFPPRTIVVSAQVTQVEGEALGVYRVLFEGTAVPELLTTGGENGNDPFFSYLSQIILYFPAQAQSAYEAAIQAGVDDFSNVKCRTYAGEAEKQTVLNKGVFPIEYCAASADRGEWTIDKPTTVAEENETVTIKSLQDVSEYHDNIDHLKKMLGDDLDAYIGWVTPHDIPEIFYAAGQQVVIKGYLFLVATKTKDVPSAPEVPDVPEQTIDARWEEERGHRYAYDTNGRQILGDGNDSIVVTADGDIYANKNIYYLNPERDPANPDTCYLVTNYIRVRPNDGGLTFYDADGISFYGWMHAEGGGMRFQTRLENIPGVDPYCIFVWHAQYLPSVQHPDHPGDPAYFLPAGWYLFDDDGVRITADGEYDYKYDVDQQMHHYTVKDGMIVAIDGVAVS